MSKIRQKRTADQVHRLISELIRRDLNDPRLKDLSVTKVDIDRELEHADIYINALADETRQKEVMVALRKAGGYLKRELSKQLPGRSTPQLHFHWDPTLANAEEVRTILDGLDIPPPEEENPSTT
ncbi:MAG: 30S ribosome-binding factor RbfA [Chloroflexota bacterium]